MRQPKLAVPRILLDTGYREVIGESIAAWIALPRRSATAGASAELSFAAVTVRVDTACPPAKTNTSPKQIG